MATTRHVGMATGGARHGARSATRCWSTAGSRRTRRCSPGRYRLQILNSSLFSSYDFALSNGRPFTQIGTGSGLLPHPVVRQDILLGPAQRADVVVDFRGQAGKNVLLVVDPAHRRLDDGHRQPRGGAHAVPGARQARPEGAGPVQPWPRSSTTRCRGRSRRPGRFGLSKDRHGPTGRSTASASTRSGSTTGSGSGRPSAGSWSTPARLHPLRAPARGALADAAARRPAPPPWERGYEDTWRLDPGESVVVAARFTDYTGKFMIHCHMLDHEDDGMMATVQGHAPVTSREAPIGGDRGRRLRARVRGISGASRRRAASGRRGQGSRGASRGRRT